MHIKVWTVMVVIDVAMMVVMPCMVRLASLPRVTREKTEKPPEHERTGEAVHKKNSGLLDAKVLWPGARLMLRTGLAGGKPWIGYGNVYTGLVLV